MSVTVTEPKQRGDEACSRCSAGEPARLIGLILLCVFLSVSTNTFLSFRNALNILDQITVLGIMAVGMSFVILTGGIDLSVGSVLALAMMVMGWLSNVQGLPLPLAILIALIAAGLCGLVSGLLITAVQGAALHRDARHDVGGARRSRT